VFPRCSWPPAVSRNPCIQPHRWKCDLALRGRAAMPPQQSEGTRGDAGYAALPRRFQYGPPAVLRQTRPSTRVPASPRPTPLLATRPPPRPPLRPLRASSAGAAHRRPRHPHPGRALRPFPNRPVGWKGRPRDRFIGHWHSRHGSNQNSQEPRSPVADDNRNYRQILADSFKPLRLPFGNITIARQDSRRVAADRHPPPAL
jgi:hypothetical protein